MFIGYRNGSANWEWEFGFSVKGGNDSLLELKWSEKPDHKRKRLDTFFFFFENVSLYQFHRDHYQTKNTILWWYQS